MVVVVDMDAHMGAAHPSFLSFCLTLALGLALAFTSHGASAAILSKSNIEKCDKRSSKEMKCRQKIVIQLAVAAGKDSGEDEISATIDTVSNGSNVQSLQDPQVIKLSKSNVGYAYPLEYLQNFNRQPYEEARQVNKCNPDDCWDRNLSKEQKTSKWGICCNCGGKSAHRGLKIDCGFSSFNKAGFESKQSNKCQ